MNISAENVISIAGLYLTLVGLLSSFFFVSLGQWLNGILGTESKWRILDGRNDPTLWDKKLECYFESRQSASPATFVAWAAVTLFQLVLFFFIYRLYCSAGRASAPYIAFYVNLPCYIFLGVYLLLSITMLIIGYSKAKNVFKAAAGQL